MRSLNMSVILVTLLVASLEIARADDLSSSARVSYVSFPSLHPDRPVIVAGRLIVPSSSRLKVPAVLIVHGSAGLDGRGPLMAAALTQGGLATLEIDMWAPRGLKGGADRPRGVIETLPDAFGALRFLGNHSAIDPERIGITGFSWGGIVSMLTASKPLADQYAPAGLRFRGHSPFYPVCWIYNNPQQPEYVFKELTGEPVFIQGGELDAYDEPETCEKLVDSLSATSRRVVSLKMYPGATHAFDDPDPEHVFWDSAAKLGRGGEVRVTPNPAVAAMAREATVKFFSEIFGLTK